MYGLLIENTPQMKISTEFYHIIDVDGEFMLTVNQSEMNHLTKDSFKEFIERLQESYEYLFE